MRAADMKRRGWRLYILRCRDGTLYTGVTSNLARRLAEHNLGRGCRYTRSRKPVKLVYAGKCPSRAAALRSEARMKRLSRAEKLMMIRGRKRRGRSR